MGIAKGNEFASLVTCDAFSAFRVLMWLQVFFAYGYSFLRFPGGESDQVFRATPERGLAMTPITILVYRPLARCLASADIYYGGYPLCVRIAPMNFMISVILWEKQSFSRYLFFVGRVMNWVNRHFATKVRGSIIFVFRRFFRASVVKCRAIRIIRRMI